MAEKQKNTNKNNRDKASIKDYLGPGEEKGGALKQMMKDKGGTPSQKEGTPVNFVPADPGTGVPGFVPLIDYIPKNEEEAKRLDKERMKPLPEYLPKDEEEEKRRNKASMKLFTENKPKGFTGIVESPTPPTPDAIPLDPATGKPFVPMPKEGPIIVESPTPPTPDAVPVPPPTGQKTADGKPYVPGMAKQPMNQADAAMQQLFGGAVGVDYSGMPSPMAQSFNSNMTTGDKMAQGLKTVNTIFPTVTPEAAALTAVNFRDQSPLSDKQFKEEFKPNEYETRTQQGEMKVDSSQMQDRASVVDDDQNKQAIKMVKENPSIISAWKTVDTQKTALQKMLDIEKSIPTWSKIDMTMGLALFDELNGTKLAKSYKPYERPDEAISQLRKEIALNEGKAQGMELKLYNDLFKDTDKDKQGLDVNAARKVEMQSPASYEAKIKAAQAGNPNAVSLKATDSFNKILDIPAMASVQSNLNVIDSIMEGSKGRYGGYIPGFNAPEKYLRDKEGNLNILGEGANIIASVKGGDSKKFADEAERVQAAREALSREFTKIYSGASSSDQERLRFAKELLGNRGATQDQLIERHRLLKERVMADVRARLAIIQGNPELAQAYAAMTPADPSTVARFNALVNARPEVARVFNTPLDMTPPAKGSSPSPSTGSTPSEPKRPITKDDLPPVGGERNPEGIRYKIRK